MRIRTIKPEFYLHEGLAELPALTRLLFTGLWGLADIAGRLEDRPRRIKPQVLPHDEVDVDAALQSLADAGFIVRYEVEGLKLIEVINFKKHQRIQGDESKKQSIFPAPPTQTGKNTLVTPTKQESNASEAGQKQGSNGEEYFSNGQVTPKNNSVTDKNTGKGKGKERSNTPFFSPAGGRPTGQTPDFSTPLSAEAEAALPQWTTETPQPTSEPPTEPTPKPPPKPVRASRPTLAELIDLDELAIPAELNSPAFREIWRKWLQIRLQGKIPKRGWPALFAAHLDRLTQPDIGTEAAAIASLTQSIVGDYTGIFPVKTAPNSSSNPRPLTPIFA